MGPNIKEKSLKPWFLGGVLCLIERGEGNHEILSCCNTKML